MPLWNHSISGGTVPRGQVSPGAFGLLHMYVALGDESRQSIGRAENWSDISFTGLTATLWPSNRIHQQALDGEVQWGVRGLLSADWLPATQMDFLLLLLLSWREKPNVMFYVCVVKQQVCVSVCVCVCTVQLIISLHLQKKPVNLATNNKTHCMKAFFFINETVKKNKIIKLWTQRATEFY